MPRSDASFGFSRRARWRSPRSACFETAPLRLASALLRVVAGADVVELDVEDEDRRGRVRCLERRRVGRLDRQHVEEAAEDGVHGEERRRHAAALAQELAAAQAEPRRQALGLGEDAILHLALLGRLRHRRKFLVGHEPGRQRHVAAKAPPHARADAKARRRFRWSCSPPLADACVGPCLMRSPSVSRKPSPRFGLCACTPASPPAPRARAPARGTGGCAGRPLRSRAPAP